MHGCFERSSFSHHKIATGTEKHASRLDDMHGRFRRSAYRRGENRLFLFRLQSYHGETTIVQSGRAYRRGENRIVLFRLQSSHEKTTIVQSDRAYRRGESRLLLFRLQFYHGKTTVVRMEPRTPRSAKNPSKENSCTTGSLKTRKTKIPSLPRRCQERCSPRGRPQLLDVPLRSPRLQREHRRPDVCQGGVGRRCSPQGGFNPPPLGEAQAVSSSHEDPEGRGVWDQKSA